jgi:hypothetical protein
LSKKMNALPSARRWLVAMVSEKPRTRTRPPAATSQNPHQRGSRLGQGTGRRA